jgi:hypothetical protein
MQQAGYNKKCPAIFSHEVTSGVFLQIINDIYFFIILFYKIFLRLFIPTGWFDFYVLFLSRNNVKVWLQ